MTYEELFDRPVAFHRPFVTLTGSVNAALFLSQCFYWSRRCATHEDGERWFYKTQADWEDETGLSRYEQESARKALRDKGILKEKRVGIPAKLYFSIDFENLKALFESSSCATKNAGKPHTGLLETDKQECSKPSNSSAENQQSITEITTKTTTEITTETTKPARKQKTVFALPEGLNLDAWDLWKRYRAENNLKAYKPVALGEGAAASKLISLAGGDLTTQMLIVKQSIDNQWQGLFPLKKQPYGTKPISNIEAAQLAAQNMGVSYDDNEPL